MRSPDQARRIAESLVERGIAAGATAADTLYIGERSSGVQVRLGELDHVSRSEGEEIGVRLFAGQRSATAASSDLSDEALALLVDRCMAMAQRSAGRPLCGAGSGGAADARPAAVPRFARTSASLTPPSFEPGRWKRRMRRLRSPA